MGEDLKLNFSDDEDIDDYMGGNEWLKMQNGDQFKPKSKLPQTSTFELNSDPIPQAQPSGNLIDDLLAEQPSTP